MWKLLLVPVLLYFAVILFLFLAQTAMVFPVRHVGPPGPLPPGAERLEVAIRPDLRLRGVRIPPARTAQPRTLILGFGGNAANAETTAIILHGLFPETDVVSFHYRGYPPSEGLPAAAALKEDAPRLYDAMRERLGSTRTIAVGLSVGSGVAASLAARRPLDGLILVTPFDSLAAVAAEHYPWVPVRLLFRHPLEPARDLRDARVPVAIIAGGHDQVVPPARTDALRRALRVPAFDLTIPNAGHNDIYDHPDFRPAMRAALARMQ